MLDPNLPSSGLVYDSRWATFATIRQHGRLSFPVNVDGPPITYTIWHGSGFVPYVIWMLLGHAAGLYPSPGSSGGYAEVRVDANYLYVTDRSLIGFEFKYLLTRTRV
ncbi:MAG: hypothetical protein DI537_13725 [Stutzerimonas stutzeri]|nr:MAG: hypothetical protein DI537_13725 [Stutzerimonas stutzeri]